MKTAKITFFLVVLFWVFFASFSLITYVGDTPIRFKYGTTHNFRGFFPQGWAFFTKSPRDPNLEIYHLVDQKLLPVEKHRQASIINFFGLKRDARATSVEYAYLISKIDHKHWKECKIDPEEFIKVNNISPVVVENDNKTPMLKGTYVLVSRSLVPWAWAKNREKVVMPSSILVLDVKSNS